MTWKILERSPAPSRLGPPGARVVCVANQKGGVAKTTTVINLGAALALRGHRVLIVDVDPQANATTGFGLDLGAIEVSTYEVLLADAPVDSAIRPTPIRNLDLIPASQDLAGAEIELVGRPGRELRLGEALRGARAAYDLVFLDCPPSLGLLTVNALAAADDLLVPVQCEYYALEGLGHLLGNADRVRGGLAPNLRITGFLLTMYDGRTKLSSQVADEMRSHFGPLVFETIIPRSVRLSEAPSFGEPVVTLDPSSRGATAYRLLAGEVEERYALKAQPPPPPPRPQPGPGGRGYGVTTPEPDVGEAWPPEEAWTASVLAEGGDS